LKTRILIAIIWLLVSGDCFAQDIPEQTRQNFDTHFFNGMKEKMQGNTKEAVNEFKKALRILPTQANVNFQLSTVLLAERKGAEAEIYAEKAYQLEKTNEWYVQNLMDIYRYNKNYTAAELFLTDRYKTSKNPDLLYELSFIQLQNNAPKKAIKSLNQLEKKVGISEDITKQKEQIYLQLNNLSAAIRELEKLIAKFPQNQQYRGALADLYLSNGKEKEAIAIYHSILKVEPQNSYAAFALSDFYKLKNEKDSCFHYLKKGLEGNGDIKSKLGAFTSIIPSNFFEAKQNTICEHLADVLIQSNPENAGPYLIKGDLQLESRKPDKAREFYLKASEQNDGGLIAWEQILQCDQLLANYKLILADAKKTNELFPTYALGYYHSAFASIQLKAYNDAIAAIQMGIEFAEESNLRSQMFAMMGDAANYAKRYALSDSAYASSLETDPSNAYALNNYAYYLSLRNEQLDLADSLSKRSMILDPENASYADTYGWILYQKKDYNSALIYIEKSLEKAPNNAEVNEHLGDVLFKLGKILEAKNAWKKAKELGAESEALLKKLKQ
jgi:tetratricopeptide (TPR) repeat protein